MASRITIEDQDRGTWTLLDSEAAGRDGGRSLIVLAGAGFAPARLRAEAARAGTVVAADAGAALCLESDLVPAAVVGDFDSLPDAVRVRLDPALLHRSDDAATNDLEKALAWVAARGGPGGPAGEVVLAAGGGVDGGRMDHALANLGPIVREPHGRISMVDGEGRLFALRSGRAVVHGLPGRRLSLLPWSLHGVRASESGVRYPLDRAHLMLGGRGVSNELVADEATVTVHEGVALVWVEA
jgi:thiamine pyrophosphokinase